MVLGKLEDLDFGLGASAPFYAVRFDKFGQLDSPVTAQALVDDISQRRGTETAYTDLIVISHGWNNIWDDALARYRTFVARVRDVRNTSGDVTLPFRPILVGVFWPSTALVLPSEQGPSIAAEDPVSASLDEAQSRATLEVLVERLNSVAADRAQELYDRGTLDDFEAGELATLLAGALPLDEEDRGQRLTTTDIRRMWEASGGAPTTADSTDAGRQSVAAEPTDAAPDPAAPVLTVNAEGHTVRPSASGPSTAGGGGGGWSIRDLFRYTTVRVMRDRAGLVGHRGVGPLLAQLLAADKTTRMHLVGHSYGARVILNAVSRPKGDPLPRDVRSVLLLQPALNFACFASKLPGLPDERGAYAVALAKTEQAIISTFSPHDAPLRKLFHHALFRPGDLGEIEIGADDDDAPPSRFAALGGYGPYMEQTPQERMPIKHAPAGAPTENDRYDVRTARRVIAVNGKDRILSHGEVETADTAWALVNLLEGR